MSILPLTIHASIAIGMLSISVPVIDTQYETVGGVDIQVPVGNRTIEAAVDASTRRTLELIFGGSVSDGDIGIWPLNSNDILYWIDNFEAQPFVDDDLRKQSFIMYGGNEYRVTGASDFTPQAGHKVYLAKKHVRQDQPQ
jgi:hypothetical protein